MSSLNKFHFLHIGPLAPHPLTFVGRENANMIKHIEFSPPFGFIVFSSAEHMQLVAFSNGGDLFFTKKQKSKIFKL